MKTNDVKQLWLTAAYYENIHKEYDCLPRSLPLLVQEAERLAASPSEAEIFFALAAELGSLEPEPEHIPEETCMMSALAVAANLPAMLEGLAADGVPRDVMTATAREIDLGILEEHDRNGSPPGFSRFLVMWYLKFLKRDILRIGRLNFERSRSFSGRIRVYGNRAGEELVFAENIPLNEQGGAAQDGETEAMLPEVTEKNGYISGHRVVDGQAQPELTEIRQADWHLLLAFGDPVYHIHIPDYEPFMPDVIRATYEKGLAILKQCWKDFPAKAMVCKSWLMDPHLRELLRENSNILAFQKPYTPFPAKGNWDSALKYVFGAVPEGYAQLPEDNSLRRSMKAYYQSGKVIRFTYAYWLLPHD